VSENIQQIISQKFPGVMLDSPVQGYYYLDQYQKGIETYQKLKCPTAEDERWVGSCHFVLANDLTASKYFSRAVQRSSTTAHINLAHSHMYTQKIDAVIPELEKVDVEALKPKDKVHYFKVKSYYEEININLGQALLDANVAWELAQTIPEHNILAPRLLQQIGTISGNAGDFQRSVQCFEQGLELSRGRDFSETVILYANHLTSIGNLSKARSTLEKIQLDCMDNLFYPLFYIASANIAWASKHSEDAIKLYSKSLNTSIVKNLAGEEFTARIALAALFIGQHLFISATEHLTRAKPLISEKYDKLTYRFREVLLEDYQHTITAEQSYTVLDKLAKSYGEMGYVQEQNWCKLHMANIKRRQGLDIIPDLNELQAAGEAMQNFNFLAREWTLAKDLHTIARYTHPRLAGVAPITIMTHVDPAPLFTQTTPKVHLSFLGKRGVRLNGKTLELPQKWCEILALLALHPDGLGGEELLAGIYGDAGCMATLKATLSKLRDVIPIASRPYTINADIQTDFIEVESLLSQGKIQEALGQYKGRLLPGSEAPSIVEQRDYLDELLRQAVILSGLDNFAEIAKPFADDLGVWEAFLQKMPDTDTRYPFIKAKVRRIRRDWGMPVSGDD
jgi:tetratricopeptide (TPR) repeat protein